MDESRSTIQVEQDTTTYVPALSTRYEVCSLDRCVVVRLPEVSLFKAIDYDVIENDLYIQEAALSGTQVHLNLYSFTLFIIKTCFRESSFQKLSTAGQFVS